MIDSYIRPIWQFKNKNVLLVVLLKILLTSILFVVYPFGWMIGHIIEGFPEMASDWKYDYREYKKIMNQETK